MIESLRRRVARHAAFMLLAAALGAALGGGWAIALSVTLPAEHEFNVLSWELRHAPNKWLYLGGRFLRGGLSPVEEDGRLGRFLALSVQIQQLERSGDERNAGEDRELARLRDERERLENDAEAIIEGRLTAVLEDAGLESSLPLFPGARWVFPPVDVEFERPPRVAAVSPRDRIELVEQRPLRPGLLAEEAVAIEQEIERSGSRSALVLSLAGAATYPSIVGPHGDYELLVETVAHEWVHHYLAFKPLGLRFYSSLELRTLNETVASIAGVELARLVVERFPLPAQEAVRGGPPADVDATLRALRIEVDRLLARGEVTEAEALMEQRRQELAERGTVIRRINQAFFAFHSVYADQPLSVDPLGAKVQQLRRNAGSVGAFLRSAAGLTGPGDLDRLLGEGR